MAAALLEWKPSANEFSNGLVCEILDKFTCTRGSPLFSALIQQVVRLISASSKSITYESQNKFRWYLDHTKSLITERGAEMSEKWLYLDRLASDGDLCTTFFPPSRYQSLLKRLQTKAEPTCCKNCGSSGERDGLFTCRGCLSFSYCSRRCQKQSWDEGHKLNCLEFSKLTFAEDALQIPLDPEAESWMKSSANFQRLYTESKEALISSQLQALRLEEEKSALVVEVTALRDQIKCTLKSKGGLSSGIKRFKQSVVNKLGGSEKSSFERQNVSFKNLEIVSPKGPSAGHFANSTFLRISSSKGPKHLAAAALKRRALQRRAHTALEAVSLLAGDEENSNDISENVKALVVQMVHLKPSLGREIIAANPTIARDVFLLTPTDANKLMQALGLSWKKTRDMANIMAKLTGCRLFPSEAKRRTELAEVTKLCSTDKLLVGKIPLFKSGKATYPTLQPFTKVANIADFMNEIVEEVKNGFDE